MGITLRSSKKTEGQRKRKNQTIKRKSKRQSYTSVNRNKEEGLTMAGSSDQPDINKLHIRWVYDCEADCNLLMRRASATVGLLVVRQDFLLAVIYISYEKAEEANRTALEFLI